MLPSYAPLIYLMDGYKLDHRRQYPPFTTGVYSNGTFRSSRIPGQNSVVFVGLQYLIQAYFEEAADIFFSTSREQILADYQNFLDNYIGPGNGIGVEHIADLHELGYIPLEFWAVAEGTVVPLRVAPFTVESTHDHFAWVTNAFETLISNVLWMPCTSATTAYRYRQVLDSYAVLQGTDPFGVNFQGHDFSMRGMSGIESAALSGLGHLLSFTGTDSIPAIKLIEKYYPYGGFIAGSVPATEHSVMCAGGQETEMDTFERLFKVYPSGILSIVSDTWDFWSVVTKILPALKNQILARDGKIVVRPDSGDPVLIICGDPSAPVGSPEFKGLIECLWDIFGGTETALGYRILDSHIGAIYGDSITEQRAREICERLAVKGYASSNIVLGIGSYTYQYVTRDTYGFAIKATWAKICGEESFLSKDPKTDNGVKKSARGRIATVLDERGTITQVDNLSYKEWLEHPNLMRKVWADGQFEIYDGLDVIRHRLHPHVF